MRLARQGCQQMHRTVLCLSRYREYILAAPTYYVRTLSGIRSIQYDSAHYNREPLSTSAILDILDELTA